MRVISNKDVKTRKDHICFGCGRELPKGTLMTAVTSVEGEEIRTEYWCKTCQTYWDNFMYKDDEIGIGELKSSDFETWEQIRLKQEGSQS